MVGRSVDSKDVGKWSDCLPGFTTSADWLFVMNTTSRTMLGSHNLPVLSSCSGIYEMASRVGPAVFLALIAITAMAFRATDSLCCAYQDAPRPDRRRHLPWITATVLLCWSPAVLWAVMMVVALVRDYVR